MNPLEENLRRINEKLQLLLKQHFALQKEHEKLKKELQEMTEQCADREKKAEELGQKLAVLRLAAGNMPDADKKDLEKRLNHYIREIDRCMAILSQ